MLGGVEEISERIFQVGGIKKRKGIQGKVIYSEDPNGRQQK
jgi:hypothetical protein